MILDSDKQIKQKIDAVLLQSELSGFARIKADVIARGVRTYYYLIQRREPEIPEYPSVVVACAQNEENLYIGKTRRADTRKTELGLCSLCGITHRTIDINWRSDINN